MINPGVPFFYFEIPEMKLKLLIRIETKRKSEGGDQVKLFPLQVGRVILAQVMGLRDEAVDWKNVSSQLDREEESKRAATFRSLFEPFDFTIET